MEERKYLKRVELLDHGFVELIDVMGSDDAIANAARTSYDKGTTTKTSNNILIRYLMRHKHSGPFEFGECVFRIRCPMFVARQWFRHRTGSYNEVSLRYSEAVEEFYLPDSEWITTQDRRNKQARTGEVVEGSDVIQKQLQQDSEMLLKHYNEYLEKGMAREIARINLPLSLYTSFMFKMDLRNLLNFLTLRFDAHAQYEIRLYAEQMLSMVEEYFPATINAWRDYTKNAISFSASEIQVLKKVFSQEHLNLGELIEKVKDTPENPLKALEWAEFEDKIKQLMGIDSSLEYLGK